MTRKGLFLLPLLVLPLARAAAGPGATSAEFLKVDVGGRASAMAGSQFGAEGDAFAVFHNPALAAGIRQKEMAVMHNEFLEDFKQDVFAYVHPTPRWGNLALGLNYFSYGAISGYDNTGAATGKLSAYDLAFSGTWARNWDLVLGESVFKDISTGVTFKMISEKLDDDQASGMALDFGLAYPFASRYLKGMKAAGSVTHLGPGLGSDGGGLPKTLRFGLSRQFWGEAFTAAVDEVVPVDSDPYPVLAMEYKLMKMFAMRFGYKGNKNLDQKLTYGIGFETPVFRVDYAFVPFGDLGGAHRASVNFRFGRSTKRPTPDKILHAKVKESKTLYAQGLLVDAYMEAVQVQRVAPWLAENNMLISDIQGEFKRLEESDRKEKLSRQIRSLYDRAVKFFEQGNLINARLEFQAVLGLDPSHKEAQGYLTQIEGQFQSLIDSFYRAGVLAFDEEDYDKARREFEKVLAINPEHMEAQERLARCVEILEAREKEAAEAIKLEEAGRIYEEGRAAYGEKNYEEALALFSRVLQVVPGHPEAERDAQAVRKVLHDRYLKAGEDYASRGEWQKAIQNLKKAMEYLPASKNAKVLLVESEKRWDLQKKVLSQKLYKEGLDAFLTRQTGQAKDLWERALELDPDNEEAQSGLSRLGVKPNRK